MHSVYLTYNPSANIFKTCLKIILGRHVSCVCQHMPAHASVYRLSCNPQVACSASDWQDSNFESCVWKRVSCHSSHHPQEVLLSQYCLHVHKGGLSPINFISFVNYSGMYVMGIRWTSHLLHKIVRYSSSYAQLKRLSAYYTSVRVIFSHVVIR